MNLTPIFYQRIPTRIFLQVEESEKLVLDWQDGHRSEFPVTWLKQRMFTAATRERETSRLRVEERLWRAESMQGNIPSVQYEEVSIIILNHNNIFPVMWLF